MPDQDFNIKVVTTADTTGVRQTSAALIDLQKQQESANRAVAQSAAGVGRIIGLALAGVPSAMLLDLKHITDEINRATKEFDKQGAKLTELSEKYHELARGVTTPDDIRQIANQALPAIKAAQDKVNDANATQLNLYERIVDSVYHLGQNVLAYGQASADSGKIHKQALDLATNGAERLLALSEQLARGAIKEGEAYEAAFERRKTEPFEQALGEINSEIEKLRNHQKELAREPFFSVEEYTKAANGISALERQVRALTKAHNDSERAADAAAKAAQKEAGFIQGAIGTSSGQTQAVLRNELAAQQAAAAGDQKGADQFAKTAAQLEAGMTPDQRAELQGLRKATPRPLGPKAGIGESQDLVDQIELNRRNNEHMIKGEKLEQPASRDQALIDYMKTIWGPG